MWTVWLKGLVCNDYDDFLCGRSTTVEETTFHLLHISLLREYLDLEFASVKHVSIFPYYQVIMEHVYCQLNMLQESSNALFSYKLIIVY